MKILSFFISTQLWHYLLLIMTYNAVKQGLCESVLYYLPLQHQAFHLFLQMWLFGTTLNT